MLRRLLRVAGAQYPWGRRFRCPPREDPLRAPGTPPEVKILLYMREYICPKTKSNKNKVQLKLPVGPRSLGCLGEETSGTNFFVTRYLPITSKLTRCLQNRKGEERKQENINKTSALVRIQHWFCFHYGEYQKTLMTKTKLG